MLGGVGLGPMREQRFGGPSLTNWDDGLEGPGRTIAASDGNPIRVAAGPGTGKTFALKRRVARLITAGVQPTGVLAVTFTRTAARQLVDEVCGMGLAGCELIKASTLHSLCFSILGQNHVFERTQRVSRMLLTAEEKKCLAFEGAPLVEDLGKPHIYGAKRDKTRRIRAYEASWARLQHDQPGWPTDPVDRQFEHDLISWLRFHEGMMVGELVPETLRYLRSNPAAPERQRFKHVLVDEYQDLNRAEQAIVELLAAGSLVVVGDEDQSIYSFRHAHPEGMADFLARHQGAVDVPLIECRRCPSRVTDMASALIEKNHGAAGSGPRLTPKRDAPAGVVNIVQWGSFEAEIAGVAEYVRHLVSAEGLTPGEILVLCARKQLGHSLRDALTQRQLSAHSFYNEVSLGDEQAQQAIALLTLLADENDRIALRFWLGLGDKKWRSRAYGLLRAHCETTNQSPMQVLDDMAAGALNLPDTDDLVSRHAELNVRIGALSSLAGAELVDVLFPDGDEWAEGLRISALRDTATHGSPAQILDRVRLDLTQPEMPPDGEFIRIMSLHKSKGLTSRAVIVMGCVEGLVPYVEDSLDPVAQSRITAEQRRLFYVAVTRCREYLLISSARDLPPRDAHRMRVKTRGSGPIVSAIASRFIDELGAAAPAPVTGDGFLRGLLVGNGERPSGDVVPA